MPIDLKPHSLKCNSNFAVLNFKAQKLDKFFLFRKSINHIMALFMKKNFLFIGFFIFLFLLSSKDVSAISLVGNVASQQTNVSIFILPSLPSLTIINPENKTYITNISLPLIYSASFMDNVWYNLNSLANITITSSSIKFNTSEGSNTLYLYANNSNGITAKNITFYVNLSLLIILYQNYNGLYKGASIDFIHETYENLQNLSNVYLEDTRYGKIYFLQPISFTDVNINRTLDLDNNTEILFNRVGLDSAVLSNFNKPATIQIYNLSFNNPRILRDGAPCSDLICTIESYANGTLKFNITQFSFYSADETPSPTAIIGGPGGGGGGGCLTNWNCTDWEPKICINKTQTRICVKAQQNCSVITDKPDESRACEGEKKEFPVPTPTLETKRCCLFEICGFSFILCRYWWLLIIVLLIAIIIAIIILSKRVRKRTIKKLSLSLHKKK